MISSKLSKRLKSLADAIEGRRLVDVGCDHGKVVNYLLKNSLIDFAICTDISLPSVKKAEKLLKENNIKENCFSIRCGDGLKTITDEDNIDSILIAGMGGKEIIKILSESKFLPKILILQPQRNMYEVKNYIIDIGFTIVYDKIIYDDGKFYNIIKCKKLEVKQDKIEFDLHFGKSNFEDIDDDFIQYLIYLKEKYLNLVSKVNIDNRQNIDNMLNFINKALEKCRRD